MCFYKFDIFKTNNSKSTVIANIRQLVQHCMIASRARRVVRRRFRLMRPLYSFLPMCCPHARRPAVSCINAIRTLPYPAAAAQTPQALRVQRARGVRRLLSRLALRLGAGQPQQRPRRQRRRVALRQQSVSTPPPTPRCPCRSRSVTSAAAQCDARTR